MRRGVLALSLQGRPLPVRHVASAPTRPVRRRHRLVLTRAPRHHASRPPRGSPRPADSAGAKGLPRAIRWTRSLEHASLVDADGRSEKGVDDLDADDEHDLPEARL